MSKKKVIVIGGNHHNTLGVLRSLGEKGVFSELILVTSSKYPYVKYSKYIFYITFLVYTLMYNVQC